MKSPTPMRSVNLPGLGLVIALVLGVGAGCSSTNHMPDGDPNTGAPTASGEIPTALEKAAVEFLIDAANERRLNIAAARLAARRGATEGMRDYARSIIGQQELLLGRLERIAGKNQVLLPRSLSDKQQETLRQLRGLERDSFDREYLKAIIAGCQRDARAFEFASTLPNEDVRTLGVEFAPTMQLQIEEAESRLEHLGG